MTLFLLDTSVLISLLDPDHPQRLKSRSWFAGGGSDAWATCPIVENGAIRIMSGTHYFNPRATPIEITSALKSLTSVGSHHFLADSLSILDSETFDLEAILTPNQITDTYLVALAAKHGAVLATLDTRIVTTAVRVPGARVHVIGQRPSPR